MCLDFQAEGLRKPAAQTQPSRLLISPTSTPENWGRACLRACAVSFPVPGGHITAGEVVDGLFVSQVQKWLPRVEGKERRLKAVVVIQAGHIGGDKLEV